MNILPRLVIVILLLLVGCAAPEEPTPRQDMEAPLSTAPPEQPPAEATTSFPPVNQPDRVCNALASQGLAPASGEGWEYIRGLGYTCIAELEVTPGGYSYVGDVPNVIQYTVMSDVGDHVERIQLSASIFNEQRGATVVSRLKELTQTLFSQLDLTLPEGLPAAIEGRRSETFDADYGTVTLTHETYKMGYGLIVEVDLDFAQ